MRQAESVRRPTWPAIVAFGAALLASAHHWLHVMLLSLGFGVLAPVASPFWRPVMLFISLATTSLMAGWLLRARNMPASQFWGMGVGTCLSAALVAFTVVRDGF